MKSEVTLIDELKITDQHLRIFVESGFCYLNLNRFKEAGEVFRGLISIKPDQDIAHIGLGNVYFAQNRLGEAQKEHEEAIRLNPKSALAKTHYGEVLLFRKEREAAIKELKEAIKLDPKGLTGQFARSLLDGIDKGVFD